MERAEQRRQQVGADRGAGADAEAAAGQAAQGGEVLLGGALGGEQRGGVAQQHRPGFGQGYTAGSALQQPSFHLRLELAHAPGHRGLADAQRLGRPGEAAVLGDGGEQAEQVQVESHNHNLYERYENVFEL